MERKLLKTNRGTITSDIHEGDGVQLLSTAYGNDGWTLWVCGLKRREPQLGKWGKFR
jgi:hypothetical protein